jgi:KaiC/GvpD/RAD55 family RecA-like ATPase
MSDASSLERIMGDAQEEERQYEWLKAADHYRQGLTAIAESGLMRKGEISENLAHSVYKAAFQAEYSHEFKERMGQALTCYGEAKKFYKSSTDPKKAPRISRCAAMIAFANYWLASDVAEKKRLTDECWRLTEEALEGFEQTEDYVEYAKTYVQLALSADLGFFLEWDFQARRNRVKEAVEHGERTITLLSTHEDISELVAACVKTGAFIDLFSFYFLGPDKGGTYFRKGQNYWLKAKELGGEEALLEFVSLISAPSMSLDLDTDEALILLGKAHQYASKTKDKFLLGCASDWLALHTFWKAIATEDLDERMRLAENALHYAEDAQRQYSPLSFISPRWGKLWIGAPHAEYCYELAVVEADLQKRRDLLEKGAKAASEGVKLAEISGYPGIIAVAHHVSSKILVSLAKLETDNGEKRSMLENALAHRNESVRITEELGRFDYWNRGVMRKYVSDIKSELATLATDLGSRNSLLEQALLDMEESLKLCIKYMSSFEKSQSVSFYAALGGYQYEHGDLLFRLYGFTGNKEYLNKAAEGYDDAAGSFQQLDLMSRMAECHWKASQIYDVLGEHLRSAESFEHASTDYTRAAEKIPQLKDLYQDHALYMRAWSEIEKAKLAHKIDEHAAAMKHFEKVADLLKRSKRWSYLSSNFLAWSLLEQAENSSRKGSSVEAIEAFNSAAELFREAKDAFEKEIDGIKNLDEKEKAIELGEASARRRDYCDARVKVEEARVCDQKGDYAESTKKYESAAVTFGKILETVETQAEQEEIRPIVCMCRAWQKMKIADVMVSPGLYNEASQLFLEVKEHTTKERTILLASGNSAFCQALEHGTRFEATREKADLLRVKQHLESATSYYLKAGYESASLWTSATETLFDAYTYMLNAEMEFDPDRKMKAYILAEKCLERSAQFYETAGYIGKRDEVLKIYGKVKEKREFALTLGELLTVPSEASSTSLIPAPPMTKEESVGVSKFENAFVQANLFAHKTEATVCENWDLGLQFVNVGKNPALLIRIEEIIPDGLDLIDEPEVYRLEDSGLDMKGKRLDPLKTEELRFTVRAFKKGMFEIKPRIIYLDEAGHQMSCEPEPITINISKTVLPERIPSGCGDIDNLMLGGIPEKYSVLLTSPSCDERDLLIRRFLEEGARKGESTFHVTANVGNAKALAEECQTNFCLFLCNPRADEIIKGLPNVFKLKGVENLTEISIALTSALRKLDISTTGPRRACIEIISDALLQHHTVSTRRWLTSIISELRSKGFTTLAVMNPHMHHQEEVQAILDLFEGEISVYEKETRKGLEKFVRIKKMYNQRYLEIELSLKKERLKC